MISRRATIFLRKAIRFIMRRDIGPRCDDMRARVAMFGARLVEADARPRTPRISRRAAAAREVDDYFDRLATAFLADEMRISGASW